MLPVAKTLSRVVSDSNRRMIYKFAMDRQLHADHHGDQRQPDALHHGIAEGTQLADGDRQKPADLGEIGGLGFNRGGTLAGTFQRLASLRTSRTADRYGRGRRCRSCSEALVPEPIILRLLADAWICWSRIREHPDAVGKPTIALAVQAGESPNEVEAACNQGIILGKAAGADAVGDIATVVDHGHIACADYRSIRQRNGYVVAARLAATQEFCGCEVEVCSHARACEVSEVLIGSRQLGIRAVRAEILDRRALHAGQVMRGGHLDAAAQNSSGAQEQSIDVRMCCKEPGCAEQTARGWRRRA